MAPLCQASWQAGCAGKGCEHGAHRIPWLSLPGMELHRLQDPLSNEPGRGGVAALRRELGKTPLTIKWHGRPPGAL